MSAEIVPLPAITPEELYAQRPNRILIEADALMRFYNHKLRKLWTNDGMQPINLKIPKGAAPDVIDEVINRFVSKGWDCKRANNDRKLTFEVSRSAISRMSKLISEQRLSTRYTLEFAEKEE